MKTNNTFILKVTRTDKVCAIGEEVGRRFHKEKRLPVFACEGGCIKGEIARLAANLVAKDVRYERACHGELFTVPHADLGKWVKEAEKVVVIDGCSILCHGRIARNNIENDKLIIFDALTIHRKYADLMDIDDVPEAERKQTAKELADKILAILQEDISYSSMLLPSSVCGGESLSETKCGAS